MVGLTPCRRDRLRRYMGIVKDSHRQGECGPCGAATWIHSQQTEYCHDKTRPNIRIAVAMSLDAEIGARRLHIASSARPARWGEIAVRAELPQWMSSRFLMHFSYTLPLS